MALKMDPNSGPLTLEHDHTRPRDLAADPNLGNPLYQDFRFKGWPDGNFQHTKHPQYKRMSASYMNPSEVNRYFGKSQHFDTDYYYARPKLDEGNGGGQYASRDFPDTQPQSGPMRGLGFDPSGTEMERERQRREMAELEADRVRVRNEEKLRAMQRDEERRRDMEMLRQYDPWGRPGGGAPRGENRKMKFTEHQMTPRDKNLEYKDNWDGPGYQPSLPTDPRRERSGDDKQMRQDELRRQEERLSNLKHELEHLKASQDYSDRDSFQDRARAEQNGYDRGYRISRSSPETNRSYVNPNEEYDNLGKIGKAKKPNREVLPIYYPFGKPGGGAPIMDNNKKIHTTLHGYSDDTPEARRQKAINAKLLAATLDQQVEHEHMRKKMEKEDKRRPFGELAVIFDDKQTGKPRRDPITGQLQNHHLGNSDVSLQKMNYQPQSKDQQRAYHDTLDFMSDERNRRQKLGKLKEYQEGRRHYETMDQLWGRHGGGAPKGHELRKANLDDILHHPTRDQSTEEYIKKKDWSEVEPDKFFIKDDDDLYDMRRSPVRGPSNPLTAREDGSYSPLGNPKKFVRSTVTSNHANQYDYREDYPKKDYRVGAPYALQM